MSSSNFPKLTFALHKGHWVSINEVTSGLACNCRCPVCDTPLIARKGEKHRHHFAHYQQKECSHALETTLHLLAKHLIQESKALWVPPINIFQHGQWRVAQWQAFEEANIEVPLQSITADLLLQKPNRRLAVEIKVSHQSSTKKCYQYEKLGIDTIEIDVLSIYQELYLLGKCSIGSFIQALIYDARHQ